MTLIIQTGNPKIAMKKLILCLLCLLPIACQKPESQEKEGEVKTNLVVGGYSDIPIPVRKFEFDGHSYLLFGEYSGASVVHDPKCSANHKF